MMRIGACLLLTTAIVMSTGAGWAGQNQNNNQNKNQSGTTKVRHPGGGPGGGHRHSPEHNAAVKKCGDDYKAAQRSAKTLKGKERSAALAKAKADKKQCIADAPI